MTTSKPPEQLQPPFKRPEPEILRGVWDRLNVNNQHFMCAIVGEEGSGKSLTGIRIASELDPDFNADKVHFEPDNFLERLRDETFTPGDVYVLDEAGVSLGVRTWHDEAQIQVNKAFQLIRSHNIGLIFTLPRLSELDSQTQGRLQAFFEITTRKDDYVVGKWKNVDPDRTGSGTDYQPFERLERNGCKLRVTSIAFGPPTGEFVDEYHQRKKKHQKETYDKAISAIRGEKREEEERELNAQQIADMILEDGPEDYIADNYGQKYIDRDLISVDYGIGEAKTRRVKKVLQREGVLDDIDD